MAEPMHNYNITDYHIIRMLYDNARVPAAAIAKELDLDVRHVKKRIQALMDSGAIHTSVLLEPSEFGFPCIVEFHLDVEPSYLNDYITKLSSSELISYVAVQWDKNRLEVQARFPNNKELYHYVNIEVPTWPGVTLVSSSLIPFIIKNIDSWLPLKEDFPNS